MSNMLGDFWQDLRGQTFRILMYHSVSDTPNYPWAVSPQNFSRQMEAIARSGLEVIGLDQIVRLADNGESVSKKVVITFDDGYVDNLTLAAPIMARYGFAATVFVSTGKVGGQNDWDSDQGWDSLPLLEWGGLKKLHDMGHTLGGHTHKHVNLTEIGDPALEIEEPIRLIREKTGQKFIPFAYPYGKWNHEVRQAVIRAGYGCSCIAGGFFGNHSATDRWLLKREPVLWKTTGKDFQARLEGVRNSGYWRLGLREELIPTAIL